MASPVSRGSVKALCVLSVLFNAIMMSDAAEPGTVIWQQGTTTGSLHSIASPNLLVGTAGNSLGPPWEIIFRSYPSTSIASSIWLPHLATSIAVSPDGSRIAVAGDHKISVYDGVSHSLIKSWSTPADTADLLRWGKRVDGRRVLCGTYSAGIVSWTEAPGDWIEWVELAGPVWVTALETSPNGRYLAYSSQTDLKVHIKDLHELNPPVTIPIHAVSLSFHPGGTLLACGTANGVSLRRTTDWTEYQLASTPKPVYAVAFRSSGNELWIGTGTDNGENLMRISLQGAILLDYGQAVVGRTVRLSSASSSAVLHDTFTESPAISTTAGVRYSAPGHRQPVYDVDVSANGLYGLSASEDGTWNLWRNSDGASVLNKLLVNGSILRARFSYDSTKVVALETDFVGGGHLSVYSLLGVGLSGPDIVVSSPRELTCGVTGGVSVALFNDGSAIKRLKLTDYSVGTVVASLPASISDFALSADGMRLGVATSDGVVRVYRTDTWVLISTISSSLSSPTLAFDTSTNWLYCFSSTGIAIKKAAGNPESWVGQGSFVWPSRGIGSGSVSKDNRTLVLRSGRYIGYFYRSNLQFLGESELWDGLTSPRIHVNNGSYLVGAANGRVARIKNSFPSFVSTAQLVPSTITKGQSCVLTVNLTKPAPPGGLTVNLVDYTTSVFTPPFLTVAAGQYSGSATLITVPTSKPGTYTITAKLFGYGVNTQLTVL